MELLKNIIQSNLAHYVEDVDKQTVKVGYNEGLEIHNLRVKKDFVNSLLQKAGVDARLELGHVGKLRLVYTALPGIVTVQINELDLRVRPNFTETALRKVRDSFVELKRSFAAEEEPPIPPPGAYYTPFPPAAAARAFYPAGAVVPSPRVVPLPFYPVAAIPPSAAAAAAPPHTSLTTTGSPRAAVAAAAAPPPSLSSAYPAGAALWVPLLPSSSAAAARIREGEPMPGGLLLPLVPQQQLTSFDLLHNTPSRRLAPCQLPQPPAVVRRARYVEPTPYSFYYNQQQQQPLLYPAGAATAGEAEALGPHPRGASAAAGAGAAAGRRRNTSPAEEDASFFHRPAAVALLSPAGGGFSYSASDFDASSIAKGTAAGLMHRTAAAAAESSAQLLQRAKTLPTELMQRVEGFFSTCAATVERITSPAEANFSQPLLVEPAFPSFLTSSPCQQAHYAETAGGYIYYPAGAAAAEREATAAAAASAFPPQEELLQWQHPEPYEQQSHPAAAGAALEGRRRATADSIPLQQQATTLPRCSLDFDKAAGYPPYGSSTNVEPLRNSYCPTLPSAAAAATTLPSPSTAATMRPAAAATVEPAPSVAAAVATTAASTSPAGVSFAASIGGSFEQQGRIYYHYPAAAASGPLSVTGASAAAAVGQSGLVSSRAAVAPAGAPAGRQTYPAAPAGGAAAPAARRRGDVHPETRAGEEAAGATDVCGAAAGAAARRGNGVGGGNAAAAARAAAGAGGGQQFSQPQQMQEHQVTGARNHTQVHAAAATAAAGPPSRPRIQPQRQIQWQSVRAGSSRMQQQPPHPT